MAFLLSLILAYFKLFGNPTRVLFGYSNNEVLIISRAEKEWVYLQKVFVLVFMIFGIWFKVILNPNTISKLTNTQAKFYVMGRIFIRQLDFMPEKICIWIPSTVFMETWNSFNTILF